MPDGSFFVGGQSQSAPGGNKTSPRLDSRFWPSDPYEIGDVWVVKLNRSGVKQGGRVLYRQNYFDMSAVYAPSFNPLRFLSGIPGFALTRWTHNWRNAYGP